MYDLMVILKVSRTMVEGEIKKVDELIKRVKARVVNCTADIL